jgi:hypothetical protein
MRCKSMMRYSSLVVFVACCTHANEFPDTPIRLDRKSDGDSVIAILETLVTQLNGKERELSGIRQRVHTAPGRDAIELMSAIREEVRDLRLRFERFVVDVDIRPFSEESELKFDWQQEIGKLLKPILAEVEFATRQSRAIGELRSQITSITRERDLAEDALANIGRLTGLPASPELSEQLETIVDAASILDIKVLFKAAESSSLDYQVWVDLAGDAAPFFEIVEYQIQCILVDVCIEQGWEIPFTQVTLHHAENSADIGRLNNKT